MQSIPEKSAVCFINGLLTIERKTGEKFIYRLLEASTFTEFIEAPDRDKFYRNNIEANKKFKRIQIFG